MAARRQQAYLKGLLTYNAHPLTFDVRSFVAQMYEVTPFRFQSGYAGFQVVFSRFSVKYGTITDCFVHIFFEWSHCIRDLLQLPVILKTQIHCIFEQFDLSF